MKKLLILSLITICSSFSFTNYNNENSPIVKTLKNVTTNEYSIRLGLKDLNGSTRLSGWEDIGDFYATNTETGEVYYSERSNSALPGYILDLPEGTYEFSARQGQGGWVGYGSTTVTLAQNLVDTEGYITVYVPISWAE